MSRPWNSFLRLRVGPDAVEATLRSGWPRGAPPLRARKDVEPAADPAAADAGRHAAAIDAALQEITAHAPLKGARLQVELTGALLHLDVVEGDFASCADRQLQGIAHACAAEMLGDAAADHDVRWQLQRDDRHLLIVAILRSRLAVFEDVAQRYGMRLHSVQPEFVVLWNQFGKSVRTGHGVFAVCAATDLSIAAVVDGTISSISTGPGIDLQDDDPAGNRSALAIDRVYAKPSKALFVASYSGAGHGVFSSTRLLPQQGIDALDARVDRLLYGTGQDPVAQSAFILVAPDASTPSASERWAVMSAAGAAA